LITDHNFEIEKINCTPPPFPLVIKNKFFGDLLLTIFNFFNKIAKQLFAFQFLMIVRSKPDLEYLLKKAAIK